MELYVKKMRPKKGPEIGSEQADGEPEAQAEA